MPEGEMLFRPHSFVTPSAVAPFILRSENSAGAHRSFSRKRERAIDPFGQHEAE
jgi:hypothetical protein